MDIDHFSISPLISSSSTAVELSQFTNGKLDFSSLELSAEWTIKTDDNGENDHTVDIKKYGCCPYPYETWYVYLTMERKPGTMKDQGKTLERKPGTMKDQGKTMERKPGTMKDQENLVGLNFEEGILKKGRKMWC